jgi:hypothetical protein
MSSLQQSAFYLLGATTRDDRRRILSLADEKSLEIDPAAFQKARSDLIHPRTRLGAEIAWLPGVSPNRAAQLVDLALHNPKSIRAERGLPLLAQANLLAEAFERMDGHNAPGDVSAFMGEMAQVEAELAADDVARQINEDRAVAGFPEARLEHVEAELAERRRYFRSAIKESLNRMAPAKLVEAMTLAIDGATAGGERHAPALIDELVDSYEVEAQGFLQAEADNVGKLIGAARAVASRGEGAVSPIVDKLAAVVRNWDRVAQPIQLSAKARGLDHDPSTEIAYVVRSLAVDLFNEQGMLTVADRITALLREVFAELPEVSERVETDARALKEIATGRERSEEQSRQWARRLTYSVDLGTILKSVLAISPQGVWWKNRHYPLESVTHIRWGGAQNVVNGIPAGTTYTVAFGDTRSEAVAEFSSEQVFGSFVERLWRGVGVRLLVELLEALRAGQRVGFGDAVVHDNGVVLTRRRLFGASERIPCAWPQLHVWSSGGSFYVGAKDDKKLYVQLSYIDSPNAHVLEHAIRTFFRSPARRLSDLLGED